MKNINELYYSLGSIITINALDVTQIENDIKFFIQLIIGILTIIYFSIKIIKEQINTNNKNKKYVK